MVQNGQFELIDI